MGPPLWGLMAVFALVLVCAVLYEVIPHSTAEGESESLTELNRRLDWKYKEREEELRKELEDLRVKNENLEREIKRMKGESK